MKAMRDVVDMHNGLKSNTPSHDRGYITICCIDGVKVLSRPWRPFNLGCVLNWHGMPESCFLSEVIDDNRASKQTSCHEKWAYRASNVTVNHIAEPRDLRGFLAITSMCSHWNMIAYWQSLDDVDRGCKLRHSLALHKQVLSTHWAHLERICCIFLGPSFRLFKRGALPVGSPRAQAPSGTW